MRSLLLLLSVFFISPLSFSQKNETAEVLLAKANELLYKDPAQTLKIGAHLLTNATNATKRTQVLLVLSKSHFIAGNYSQSVANINAAIEESKRTGNKNTESETLLLAAEIYAFLDLHEISRKYYSAARSKGADDSMRIKVGAYQWFVAGQPPKTQDARKFLKSLRGDYSIYSFISRGAPFHLAAKVYAASNNDSAKFYYDKSITATGIASYWTMMALMDYSDYYFGKKEYKQAVSLLNQVLENSKMIRNPIIVLKANQKLSNCYLALNNNKMFREHRQKALRAPSDLDIQTTMSTNFAFETLQKQKTSEAENAKSAERNLNWILVGVAFMILLIWMFLRWHFATRINHQKDIINYVKLIKISQEKKLPIIKPAVKNL